MFKFKKPTHRHLFIKLAVYATLGAVIFAMFKLLEHVVAKYPDYSSLPAGLAKASLAVATLVFVDEVILGRVNTFEKMKENGIVYAIIFLAFAFVIGMAFSAT